MKKGLKALLLAMVLVTVPVASFGASSVKTEGRDNRLNAGSHSSGGGGSSSSGNSSGTVGSGWLHGIVEVVDTFVTTVDGRTWNVGATYTRLDDGVVTALIGDKMTDSTEAEKSSVAHVATGAGKLAGLPESTQTVIGEVDWGDMSGVSGVDLSGYKAYGTTIAVRSEAGSTATIYCSDLPASGAKILFYNNYTQTWSLIDCTVDAGTGTVTFVAPTSGTAQIVGA